MYTVHRQLIYEEIVTAQRWPTSRRLASNRRRHAKGRMTSHWEWRRQTSTTRTRARTSRRLFNANNQQRGQPGQTSHDARQTAGHRRTGRAVIRPDMPSLWLWNVERDFYTTDCVITLVVLVVVMILSECRSKDLVIQIIISWA